MGEELVVLLNSLKSGPTFVTEKENGDALTTNAPIEEEEDSMQDYANVIRDTGPVPESNATSANVSDDETSSAISSKFKVSATSSKVTSREVSPTRSIDSSKLSFNEEKSSEIKGEPMEVDEPKA